MPAIAPGKELVYFHEWVDIERYVIPASLSAVNPTKERT